MIAMKYLVALLLLGGVSAVILTAWLSSYAWVMRGVERDHARARWKVVNQPANGHEPGSMWLAFTGPSKFEFDHRKIGTYDDPQHEILLRHEAESAADFLNKQLTPAGRHSQRRPQPQGEL